MTHPASPSTARKPSKEERKAQARERLKEHQGGFLGSLADLDLRYDKTLRRAFTHLARQGVKDAKQSADLKRIDLAAKEQADELLAAGSSELSYRSMRKAIQAQLTEGRIEVLQLDQLITAVKDCQQLEVMRYTETGKQALFTAESLATGISNEFRAEDKMLQTIADLVITYSDKKDPTSIADRRLAVKYLSAREQTKYRQDRRKVALEQIGEKCSQAFHFEIYKALAKLEPDEEHQQLEKDLKTMNRIYSNAESVVGAAGEGAGYVSGTAGMAVDISLAISRTGVDFLTNAITTASWRRQAKERMKAQAEDKEAVYCEVRAKLDGNKLGVAKMLADKYVRQVGEILNYSEVPIRASILATGVALDQVGAGSGTKLLSFAWNALKSSVLTVAERFQAERLSLAERELGLVQGEARIDTMDKIWQDWSGGVKERIFAEFKSNTAGSILNPTETALGALLDTTIEMIATEMLGKMSIRPAQVFDADMFMKHTSQLAGVRQKAEQAEAARRAEAKAKAKEKVTA